ncbi:MAG: ABC transporter permease subunit [Verrucomicrobiota bacterium]
MSKVLAIAGIAIRNAIRSRVVVVLLGLLLVAIIALPLTIKGDGTVGGTVQVLLRYTLGAVTLILSIATLWAGCAAISTEVQERQVHLLVTKPVYRAQLWLGKWLGLLILNAGLLALAGAATYALLRWDLRQENLAQFLVAQRVVKPVPVEIEETARKVFDEQKRRGELPPGPPDQILEAIRQQLRQQAYSIPAGLARRFVFELPNAPLPGRPLAVRYKFASSLTGKDPVGCLLVAGAPDRPDRFQKPELTAPAGVHLVRIPPAMLESNGMLTVDIANIHPVPVTMIFAPDDGVQVLVQETSFEMNLVRCLLVALCQLAFLGALAVTIGSVFSLPVAAVTAAYAVMLMNIGGYLQTLTTERNIFGSGDTPGAIDFLLHLIYVGLFWLTKPFQQANPLEPLAGGELIAWSWVGSILLWQVIVAGGAVALLGMWLFNRRELGLPE